MRYTLQSIKYKNEFEILKCKEYGNQKVNKVETLMKQVNIWGGSLGKRLCYQDEETRLFEYSDTKIIDWEFSLIHLEIKTENKVYCFSSEINGEEANNDL